MDDRKRILIVEDNHDHAVLAVSALKRCEDSYETDVVATAYECLNVLKKQNYDVILLDYSLGKDDGISVLKEIRDSFGDIPVIMVTGMGSETVAVEAMKLEVYDYIVKSTGYLNILPEVIKKSIKYHENITQRRKAEEALRESEERYRHIFEQSAIGIAIATPDGKMVTANKTMTAITGYSLRELRKINVPHMYENPEEWKGLVKAIRRYGSVVDFPVRLKDKDGTPYDALLTVSSINLGGENLYHTIVQDITERKRAEEQIKASLEEKEVLLKEIHHRVKNNLQIISSLLDLQSETVADEKIHELFKESHNRISAMALIHEKLYQSEDLAKIDLKEYLEDLTDSLLSSYGILPGVVAAEINVVDVVLDVGTLVSCGLIINEVVSNALKHAFPDGRRGKLCIDAHRDDTGKVTLIVIDNGVGLPKDFDIRKTQSLGLQLVSLLTTQLNGSLEIDGKGGTRVKVTFRLDKAIG